MIPVTGDLSILNCNDGDIKVTFDENDPQELARSQRIIEDMLKRGYILFVDEGDGKLKRVKRFNKKRNTYVIADGAINEDQEKQTEAEPDSEKEPSPKARQKKAEREVPAKRTRAVAVGRTAGG